MFGKKPSTSPTAELEANKRAVDESLQRIFDERESVISTLSAITEDLSDRATKRELGKIISELNAASSINEIRDSKQIMRWLPVFASGLDPNATNRSLTNLIIFTSREHELRVERRRVFLYPAVLALGVILVSSLLTTLVVPVFDKMFEDYGIEVPGATQILISLSREVRAHPITFVSTLVTMAGIFIALKAVWQRTGLTHLLFRPLIAGNSANVSDISIMLGRLAELLNIGIPRQSALILASLGLKSPWYRKCCKKLAAEIGRNEHWSRSKAARQFPGNMLLAMQEESKPNVPLLRELSVIYAERIRYRVDWTTGIIAQVAIVSLGVAVGFLVIALMMPLFSLISSLA